MAELSQRKWASYADWVANKQIIVDLYATKELEEVMQIMERDHDFHSTRKIYKTKIKEWDVGKRLNDEDMLAILQIKAQREAVEKDSEFWLMGKRVNELNIRRYLRRKPQILTQFQRGHRSSQARPRITCVTPPPPPEAIRRPPGLLSDTEILLTGVKDFWCMSFDSKTWILDPNGVCMGMKSGKWGSQQTDDMVSKFFAAADLLSRSDFSGAFKVLDLAFRRTGQLLQLDVPNFLPVLLLVLVRLELRGQRDTLNIFRKYLQGQVATLQHASPKYRALVQNVSALDVERYPDVFPRLFDLMITLSDQIYGPGSCLSLDVYYLRFAGYVLREDSEGQARSLKAELDKIPPGQPRGPWVTKHERLYAWKHAQVLRDKKLYDEALTELRAIESTFRGPEDDHDASRHWHFVAEVYRQRGDLINAEKCLRLALKITMTRKGGPDEDSLQYSSRKLAEVLDSLGRDEEATNVRNYSRNHIESVASQVYWDWDEFSRRTAVEPVRIPSPGISSTLAVSDPGSFGEEGSKEAAHGSFSGS